MSVKSVRTSYATSYAASVPIPQTIPLTTQETIKKDQNANPLEAEKAAMAETEETAATEKTELELLREQQKEEWEEKLEEMRKQQEEQQAERFNEMIERYREDQKRIKKALANKKKNVSYNAVADLILIASTEAVGQVRAIKGRITRKFQQTKKSGGDDIEQARRALAAMKKVIGKAKTKIKRLEEESRIEKKRDAAEKARERELQKKLREELSRRRRERKFKEQNDIMEAVKNPDTYGQEYYNDPDVCIGISSGAVSASDAALMADASMAAAADTASAAAVAPAMEAVAAGTSLDMMM